MHKQKELLHALHALHPAPWQPSFSFPVHLYRSSSSMNECSVSRIRRCSVMSVLSAVCGRAGTRAGNL